ncbi:MAG: dihydrofolate reductase family protein [Caulobacteraceae bacterium]
MRRVRYSVAMSLDGYIAGPNGEADWIVHDPDIDFAAMFKQFDAFLVGRKTFEAMQSQKGGAMSGANVFVFSNTLRKVKGVTLSNDPAATVAALKAAPGKDIWLFGGGDLFRSMLIQGLVDRVEVAVIPVLLGAGRPLLPEMQVRSKLKLAAHQHYPKSGIMMLEYEVAA